MTRQLTPVQLALLSTDELRTLLGINARFFPEVDVDRLLPSDGSAASEDPTGPPETP